MTETQVNGTPLPRISAAADETCLDLGVGILLSFVFDVPETGTLELESIGSSARVLVADTKANSRAESVSLPSL